MARIFYSMAGEGRGHAVRVRTLVEHLRHEHELVLFAPDEAYEFLVNSYGDDRAVENVRLLRIPGIKFHYTGGKLDLFKSIGHGLSYARRELPTLVNAFRRRIEAEQPDLCIADFEPSLPRAARKLGVPLMSIDHQHVLLAFDLKDTAAPIASIRVVDELVCSMVLWRGRLRGCGIVFLYSTAQDRFRTRPPGRSDAARRPGRGGPAGRQFLLSYLRTNTPPHVLETLAASGWDVRVYGLGELPRRGRVTFHAIDERRFVDRVERDATSAGKFTQAVDAHIPSRRRQCFQNVGWSVGPKVRQQEIVVLRDHRDQVVSQHRTRPGGRVRNRS